MESDDVDEDGRGGGGSSTTIMVIGADLQRGFSEERRCMYDVTI